MTFHHNTFKNNHDYDHTRNETKFNAKGPTTSHNVPLSFLCYYTIVFKIRYLIGQLGNGGKSKGGWGQALPPSPIWLMLRVVTDKTDKMKQGKFFSALVALSLWRGYLIAFVRTHPKLGCPVVQNNKFSRYLGRLPISGPHWFYRGHFGYLITFDRTHPRLGVPVVQSNKF